MNWSEIDLERFDAARFEIGSDTQTAEAARIHEAQFPARSEAQDGVRVLLHLRLRLADLQAAGHAEVHDPLSFWLCGTRTFPPRMTILLEIEDNVFAHSADGGDAALFERRDDFRRGRFQRLFLLAQPDGFDHVSGDAFGEAAGDGFDFGKFGHERRPITTEDTRFHRER